MLVVLAVLAYQPAPMRVAASPPAPSKSSSCRSGCGRSNGLASPPSVPASRGRPVVAAWAHSRAWRRRVRVYSSSEAGGQARSACRWNSPASSTRPRDTSSATPRSAASAGGRPGDPLSPSAAARSKDSSMSTPWAPRGR